MLLLVAPQIVILHGRWLFHDVIASSFSDCHSRLLAFSLIPHNRNNCSIILNCKNSAPQFSNIDINNIMFDYKCLYHY